MRGRWIQRRRLITVWLKRGSAVAAFARAVRRCRTAPPMRTKIPPTNPKPRKTQSKMRTTRRKTGDGAEPFAALPKVTNNKDKTKNARNQAQRLDRRGCKEENRCRLQAPKINCRRRRAYCRWEYRWRGKTKLRLRSKPGERQHQRQAKDSPSAYGPSST